MTKIKLCGLSRPQDIDAANRLLPDYIGFVFAPKSKRYVTPENAAALRARLRPEIKAVGVFVNEAPERIEELLTAGTIQIAQLHGTEDETYIRALQSRTDRPVWKAFKAASAEALRAAEASCADLILLDNGPGGTGESFEWALLEGFCSRPYLLAGGLDPDNAGPAVRKFRPFGLDVSSGIETDRKKDPEKMERFVRAVRNADGE